MEHIYKRQRKSRGKKSMPISSAPMNFIEAGPDVIRSQIVPVLDWSYCVHFV